MPKRLNIEEFLAKAKTVHVDKYDYSRVVYTNTLTKVAIICKEHGIFNQAPAHHLDGQNCPKCSRKYKATINVLSGYIQASEKKRTKIDVFLKDANFIHKNKYDYTLVEYKNAHTKIKIICHKHGEFEQKPKSHLFGSGCPICKESKGENIVADTLSKEDIKYIRQHKFDNCRNRRKLPFDFYLPDFNACIEYDGIQHFVPRKLFKGEIAFRKTIRNDSIKNDFCNVNNIALLRIKYDDINIEKITLDFINQTKQQ